MRKSGSSSLPSPCHARSKRIALEAGTVSAVPPAVLPYPAQASGIIRCGINRSRRRLLGIRGSGRAGAAFLADHQV